MTISRSQTGKTVSLKPPKHQQHRVIKSSSPLGTKKNPRVPFLPASKKNKEKYKLKYVGAKQKGIFKPVTSQALWKFSPDVK